LQYNFLIGFETEQLESIYWYLEKLDVTALGPMP